MVTIGVLVLITLAVYATMSRRRTGAKPKPATTTATSPTATTMADYIDPRDRQCEGSCRRPWVVEWVLTPLDAGEELVTWRLCMPHSDLGAPMLASLGFQPFTVPARLEEPA